MLYDIKIRRKYLYFISFYWLFNRFQCAKRVRLGNINIKLSYVNIFFTLMFFVIYRIMHTNKIIRNNAQDLV